jgi:hypothetical protein
LCNTIFYITEKTRLVLKRIFGPKRGNGEWRRLQNKDHSLHRSPNIGRVIKYKIFRWAGDIARLKEGRSYFKILTVKPRG